MRHTLLLAFAFCLILLAAPSASFAKNQMPVVSGTNWTHSTTDEKNAFLLGMGTIIKIEHELQQGADIPDDKSLIDSWCQGLKDMNLTQVREAVDKYYADHPDKLERPVVEVMFVEIALPNIKDKN